MDIKKFRFQWGATALPVQNKFDMLHKQSRKDALAWLVGFWWHADALEVAGQLGAMIDERKAEIARLDELQASEREKQQAAEVARAEASPAASDANAPLLERDAARRKHGKALQASREAGNAIRRAEMEKRALREPLPAMIGLRDSLLAVAAPSPRPDFAAFLLNMGKDEAEAGSKRKRRK